MRNYKELSELETLLIKFSIFNSTLQVITNGLESSRSTDISDTMYYIQNVIEDFNVDFKTAFDKIWEASKEPSPPPFATDKKWEGIGMWVDEPSKMSLDETYDQITKADLHNGFR